MLLMEDAGAFTRIRSDLESAGYRVDGGVGYDVTILADFLDSNGPPAALMLEILHQEDSARAALDWAVRRMPDVNTIVLCAEDDFDTGVSALNRGADDFVRGPYDARELCIKLERGIERKQIRREVNALRGAYSSSAAIERLSGDSASIRQVREQIQRVATGRATVLVTGETGTGKELVATAIHEASPRRKQPLIKVNCAAIPESLLESELFGHERGAFTGADQRRYGRFEEANGGTLFLDEVGDMSLPTQAKVLRALQEQEFQRVGGTRAVRVDVRVIAATNHDLAGLIARGLFRQDLFYRLNVISMHLPPLRARSDDVEAIAGNLLAELNRGQGRPKHGLRPAAIDQLRGYPWPGNVRELRNVLERAVLMGDDDWIGPEDLTWDRAARDTRIEAPGEIRLPRSGVDYREVEKSLILQALERTGWVQKDAASLLRMSRRKLNYRIQRLGITHSGWRKNRTPLKPQAEEDSDVC